MVKVVVRLGVLFPECEPNPLSLADQYANGSLDASIYREHANCWWNKLDQAENLRNLEDPDVLIARLAICLLSVLPADSANFGEHMSWFFQVIEKLGYDLDVPLEIADDHFSFEESS